MINIAKDVAEVLGGDIPQEVISAIAQDLYQRLELIVGTRIADGLTEQQMDEFEKLIEADDHSGAQEWLGREVPHYRAMVADEWAWLLGWFVAEARKEPA